MPIIDGKARSDVPVRLIVPEREDLNVVLIAVSGAAAKRYSSCTNTTNPILVGPLAVVTNDWSKQSTELRVVQHDLAVHTKRFYDTALAMPFRV